MRRDLTMLPFPKFIIFLQQKNDKSPNSSRREPNNQCKHPITILSRYLVQINTVSSF